jgi:hypothetical protein
MIQVKNTFALLAALYAISCLFEAFFWTKSNPFLVDNYIFPFAFLYTIWVAKKEYRVLGIFLFCALLFSVALLSDYLYFNTFRTETFSIAMRWLKLPVVYAGIVYGFGAFRSFPNLTVWSKYIFLVLTIINLIILSDPFGLGHVLQKMFTPKDSLLLTNFFEPGSIRIAGTFMSPNDNAVVFSLFFLFFLKDGFYKNWGFVSLAFLLVVFSQSRTMLTVIVLISLIHILFLLKWNWKHLVVYSIGAALLLLFLVLIVDSGNIKSLITGEAFYSKSWSIRMENYGLISNLQFKDWLIGQGTIHNSIATIGVHLDSEYLAIVLQYGIIGIALWIGLTLCSTFEFIRNPESSAFGWSILLIILITSVTNFTWVHTYLGPLLIAFIAVRRVQIEQEM